MALLYDATLVPGKLELLAGWLPSRPWFAGAPELEQVGAYRFDDPDGEVGVEAFVLRTAAGALLHVPVTYRASRLSGAEDHLVGTIEHSVLGTRWVYDACADPVWATTLAAAALTGGTQVELVVDRDGHREPRDPSVTVQGSGVPGTQVPPVSEVTCRDDGPLTRIQADRLELVVVHVVGTEVVAEHHLTAAWADGGTAVVAGVSRI